MASSKSLLLHNLPSITLSGQSWKSEGVIQGSRTNQPPKLTPRTLLLPKSNFMVGPRLMGPTGAAVATSNRAKGTSVAASAAQEKLKRTMLPTWTFCPQPFEKESCSDLSFVCPKSRTWRIPTYKRCSEAVHLVGTYSPETRMFVVSMTAHHDDPPQNLGDDNK